MLYVLFSRFTTFVELEEHISNHSADEKVETKTEVIRVILQIQITRLKSKRQNVNVILRIYKIIRLMYILGVFLCNI